MDSAFCLVYLYDKTADKSESSPNLLDKLVKIENEDVEIEKIMLKEHISKLPVKERKVLILRYFRGKTQTEIAKMMGVSQVQISRIEAKTLKYLRSALS
jgi:RNA polymerase sporulation-specific sigma factor